MFNYLAPVAQRFNSQMTSDPAKEDTRMSMEHPQTFLHRISPSILREIPVDLDANLDLLEPLNKAPSLCAQHKNVRRLSHVGRVFHRLFLLISNSKKSVI